MPRSAAGVYTLPAGNPVVTNTLITSTWANDTMPDLGSEITNSLDRSGRGGMLAPVKGVDGAVGAPLYSFTNEPTTGFYRVSAGVLGVAVLGINVGSFNSTGWTGASPLYVRKIGDTMTGALNVNIANAAALLLSGAGTGYSYLDVSRTSGSGDIRMAAALSAGQFISASSAGDGIIYTANSNNLWLGANAGYVGLATTGLERMRIDSSGNVGIGVTPAANLHLSKTGGATMRIESLTTGSGTLELRAPTASAGAPQITFANNSTSLWAMGGGNIGSAGSNDFAIYNYTAAGLAFIIRASTGQIQDGSGIELGWKGIPSAGTSSGTIAITDRGRMIGMTGACTIPNGVFSQGDTVSFLNNTVGALAINQGAGLTLRLAGTGSTGNRTLAGLGMATIWVANSANIWISGPGLT